MHSYNLILQKIFKILCFLYRALWYHYVMYTNKMRTFYINVLINFFVSSTCFEHHVFIIRKTICVCIFNICFSCVYLSSLAGGRMCSILEHILPPARYCITMHGINSLTL